MSIGKIRIPAHREKKCFLERHLSRVRVSAGVELALRQADAIIYSTGTQHSSLYPTYTKGPVD
jgi:hypothetical protein